MVINKSFFIRTKEAQELIDITEQVEKVVKASGIAQGICHVHSGHTTSAIILNENESHLKQDLLCLLSVLVKNDGWTHQHNAHAHLKSCMLGNSCTVPLIKGSLGLGTWQSIFFLELDGPRQREVSVTIIGD